MSQKKITFVDITDRINSAEKQENPCSKASETMVKLAEKNNLKKSSQDDRKQK